MMNYLLWLLALSVFVASLERSFPARDQPVWRKWSWSDGLHLLFNGHFIGLMLYGIAHHRVLPMIDGFLASQGWTGLIYRDISASWPLALQIIVALFAIDLVQWSVHNLLHRNSFLWKFHQVHHSVKDGEMDWIVSFRFSWWEPVIYKSLSYLPLAWFGFAPEALFFHAVFGTLIGHLNHANLTWDYGPLRYLLNNPRMHLYHHDFDAPATGQNFGIIFSCWDWMFGTAHLPDHPPRKIGFPGVERVPQDYFGQMAWPLGLLLPRLQGTNVVGSVMGVGTLGVLYALSQPPVAATPMLGEPVASSQPVYDPAASGVRHPATEQQATEAMSRFGTIARSAGWARPESAVHAKELAEALGSPTLRILDVRTPERFAEGHIPSAQLLQRSDYSGGSVPGVSLDRAALQAMLRSHGVSTGDTVVLMGDGGPEPYRLWWTLEQIGGLETRVLDGGLAAWKHLGERLAMGEGLPAKEGDVTLGGGKGGALLWDDIPPLRARWPGLQLVDTRSLAEFTGDEHNKKAARPGRIPGARHLPWTRALHIQDEVPALLPADQLFQVLRDAGIDPDEPILTYCQSGTRSSALYYAALQAGIPEDRIWNYDGSWAEYSRRAELPAEVGGS